MQLAALAGAEVTGVVGRPERAAGLTERGATATVTSIQEAEGVFDLILESAGGSSLAGAISKVAPRAPLSCSAILPYKRPLSTWPTSSVMQKHA